MQNSAIRALVTAGRGPVIAAAFFERTVQIWESYAATRLAEFDTVFDSGGHRLAISPKATVCVAASWRKGKRGGVACYDTRSGQVVWHRIDLGRVQGLRFTPAGDSLWCRVEGGPVLHLDASTGATLSSLRAVQDVIESPFSAHRLERRRGDFRIVGDKTVRVAHTTFGLLDAAFGTDAVCLTEAGGPVRCLDCGAGNERWRYQPPAGHHVLTISHQADGCFYGVQWEYEHGSSMKLIRLAPESGHMTEICNLKTSPDAFSFGAGELITSSGDVISLTEGTILRHLDFPQREYPDRPPTLDEILVDLRSKP
jgi:hypothetical protein